MAIFKKSRNENLFLLFPDGRIIKSSQDLNELRENYSFSPSTMHKWRLHKIDTEKYVDAAAILASVGFQPTESINAFGPIKLLEFPKSYNEYIAEGILTPSHLVIYYFSAPLKMEYLIVELKDIIGLTNHGGWTATFNFAGGIHIKRKKISNLNSTFFGVSEILGKDGHQNRRSVTLIDSLAKTLNEIDLKL